MGRRLYCVLQLKKQQLGFQRGVWRSGINGLAIYVELSVALFLSGEITVVTDAEHELTWLVKTASATFSLILLFTACFKCSIDYLLGEYVLYGQLETNFTLICQQSQALSTFPLLGYGMVTLMFKYVSVLKFQSS